MSTENPDLRVLEEGQDVEEVMACTCSATVIKLK